MIEKYGYWDVNGAKHFNKFNALIDASKSQSPVHFKYNNDVWENFNTKLLGTIPLNLLYKERAQQLRDKYQYLILNYSGGADSNNILRTFIDNNIKLDEVCVKWPKPLIDGKFYTPNSMDRRCINTWSEWNYSIQPTLEWLKLNKPEIRIEIKDFIGNPDTINFDKIFDKVNHFRNAGMLSTACISDNDKILTNKGISTCQIYGVDKPLLSYKKDINSIGMFFTDAALDMICSGENPENTECFYWTPDLPILPFEMAYQMSLHFELNPQDRKYLFKADSSISKSDCAQFQHNLCIKYCYDTWDYRFQTGKRSIPDASDKYSWFFSSNEFEKIRTKFSFSVAERLSIISNRYLASANTLATIASKAFYFKKLNTYENHY
jgi:hypothetical protein